jgi:hypothetical protein
VKAEAGNAPPAVSSLEPRPPPAPGRCGAVAEPSGRAARAAGRGGRGAGAVSNRYPHRRAHAGGRPPPPGARFQLRDFEVFDLGGGFRALSTLSSQVITIWCFYIVGSEILTLGEGFNTQVITLWCFRHCGLCRGRDLPSARALGSRVDRCPPLRHRTYLLRNSLGLVPYYCKDSPP